MQPFASKLQQASQIGLLICGSLALTLVLFSLIPAHANSFTVQPIRVELAAERQVFALRVRNTSQREIAVQLEVKRWQQEHGTDIYTDTDELLAVPPIFSIAANETQTIRIGLRRAVDQEQELSYRLYLRELPPADDNARGVRMALNVGIPVFVTPLTGHVNHELKWHSSVNQSGQRLLSVTNQSNGHAQITRLHGVASEHEFSRSLNDYVLPGASREWILPSDFAATDLGTLQIKARVNGKEQSSAVPLE